MKKIRDMEFSERIALIKRSAAGVPKKIEIDLSVQITDQCYNVSGNVFYVFSSTLEQDYIGIKVNETREPSINYAVHCGLITPFYRLYITTPAGQTGTMTIIYGTEAPDLMEILDHRSTTIADLANILNQLQGDTTADEYNTITVGLVPVQALAVSADRKGFYVQSDSANTDPICIGFDDNVLFATKWVAKLLPGQGWGLDNYRGEIWAISSVANQVLGSGSW